MFCDSILRGLSLVKCDLTQLILPFTAENIRATNEMQTIVLFIASRLSLSAIFISALKHSFDRVPFIRGLMRERENSSRKTRKHIYAFPPPVAIFVSTLMFARLF